MAQRGTAPSQQARGPEFNPQYQKKQNTTTKKTNEPMWAQSCTTSMYRKLQKKISSWSFRSSQFKENEVGGFFLLFKVNSNDCNKKKQHKSRSML
jgi:hypothetical protein